MFILWIFSLWSTPPSISLPTDIIKVSTLARIESNLYIYDHANKAIYCIDESGQLKGTYAEKGPAPWEFARVSTIRAYDNYLYIVDWSKFSIIVLDQNLTYKETYRTKYLVRDVLVLDKSIYTVGWNSANKNIIQKYDKSLNPLLSFAEGLKDDRMVGSQAGHISLYQDKIIFSHVYLPSIFIHTTNGKLIEKVNLPGLEEPFTSFKNLTNPASKSTYNIQDMYIVKSTVVLKLIDFTQNGRIILYLYNMATKKWIRGISPGTLISDGKGTVYRLIKTETQETNQIALEPFNILGE